ncbi:MAG: hypothetical protein IPP69_11395 [Flavobacteriales bacterium]|nr:hypothetical protein [Flavobacteriales bacterium]
MPGDFDQLFEALYIAPADAPIFVGLSRASYYRLYKKDFEDQLETTEFLTKLLTAKNSWTAGRKKSKTNQNDIITLSEDEKKQLKRKITSMQATLFKLQDRFESSLSGNQHLDDAHSLLEYLLTTPRLFTTSEKARISAHRDNLNYRKEKLSNMDLVLKQAKITALEAEIAELEGYL